ncbi:MAG: hypothetical protein U0931_15665 [Vulcanimicrobiota bacterium]
MSEPVETAFAIGVPGLDPEPPRKVRWLGLAHFLAILFGFFGPLVVLIPNFVHHGCGGPLTACKSNCKNIATALEMYACDNQGRYPPTLEKLTAGNYLKVLPTCPAAGQMTYTNYRFSQEPDSFSFACVGNNHAQAYTGFNKPSDNYPRYLATEGLLDHP